MKAIKSNAISGVKWVTLSTAIVAVISILKVSILTRFLDKADFGLMALVTVVLGFMNVFTDLGIGTAIIHKQKISQHQYSSIYWLSFGFSIILYAIVYLLAPLVANFYDIEKLTVLIQIMGLTVLFSSIGRQFRVIEQKELRFKNIALIDIVSAVISLIFSAYLAFHNFGVYALVYPTLLQVLISSSIYLLIGFRRKPILFRFNFNETKPFLGIGLYKVGGQLVNTFNRELDTLLIGTFFTAETLGGYSLAKQLVFRPASIINPILTKVASPVLAKYQFNLDILKVQYLKLVNILGTINLVVYSGIIVLAPILVRILYGPDFNSIVVLVRILSVYMFIRSLGNPMGSLLTATGRTDLGMLWNILVLIITPLSVYIGAQFSIEWVSGAVTMSMALLFYPAWWILISPILKIDFKEYFVGVFNLKGFEYIVHLLKSNINKFTISVQKK